MDASTGRSWLSSVSMVAVALMLANCGGGGDEGSQPAAPAAVPIITRMYPWQVAAGGTGFGIALEGMNLTNATVLRWNGEDRPTTVVGTTRLTARISAADVARAGTAKVTVFTPGASGGSSTPKDMAVTDDNEICLAPRSIAIVPSGTLAFVTQGGCSPANSGFLAPYAIDPATGRLSRLGASAQPIGPGNVFVTTDPLGRFVFVGRYGSEAVSARISAFTYDRGTGALSPAGAVDDLCAPDIGGSCDFGPLSVVPLSFDAASQFAYALASHRAPDGGRTSTRVLRLRIDPLTGAMTSTSTPVALGARLPRIDPQGRFAYQPVPGDAAGLAGAVQVYSIDPASGDLAAAGTVAVGSRPADLQFDPAGRFAIVPHTDPLDVRSYSVDATSGALTERGRIGTTRNAAGVLVHPSGKFVYVFSPSGLDVWNYTLDPRNGQLASTGSTQTLPLYDTESLAMTLHPSGKFAYAVVSGIELQVYAIDQDSGALAKLESLGP